MEGLEREIFLLPGSVISLCHSVGWLVSYNLTRAPFATFSLPDATRSKSSPPARYSRTTIIS